VILSGAFPSLLVGGPHLGGREVWSVENMRLVWNASEVCRKPSRKRVASIRDGEGSETAHCCEFEAIVSVAVYAAQGSERKRGAQSIYGSWHNAIVRSAYRFRPNRPSHVGIEAIQDRILPRDKEALEAQPAVSLVLQRWQDN